MLIETLRPPIITIMRGYLKALDILNARQVQFVFNMKPNFVCNRGAVC